MGVNGVAVNGVAGAMAGAVLLAIVSGCGAPAPPSPSPEQIATRAATLRPTDAHLAELYDRSCKACHAEPRASAPLTGDRVAWLPRLAKGKAALMQSVLTGFNGMPAGGQCFTCTPSDYARLIAFMAGGDPP